MKSRTYLWSALALSALLFLFLNLFANNFFIDTRLDLTKSRQYTLTDGTRAIIAKPDRAQCAPKCHHLPHVKADWSADKAFEQIIGPGHGR